MEAEGGEAKALLRARPAPAGPGAVGKSLRLDSRAAVATRIGLTVVVCTGHLLTTGTIEPPLPEVEGSRPVYESCPRGYASVYARGRGRKGAVAGKG
jgi:hypothetical protein